jgi:signal transduction histidine kinase
MTALTMHVSLLQQQLGPDEALQQRSAQMKQLLATIIDTNRNMQLALWNDKLEFLGLKAALDDVAKLFGASQPTRIELSLPDEEVNCPRQHALALLRCLEEALRNVAAHASATEVKVILDANDEQITLTVRDNGVGVHTPVIEPHHCHGLRLLRERALHLGGKLTLEGGAQGGAVLSFVLPSAT